MSSLRMAAKGRIWQGDIIIVAPELESGACDGAQLEEMTTMQERNGWWWALERSAECGYVTGGNA